MVKMVDVDFDMNVVKYGMVIMTSFCIDFDMRLVLLTLI